MPLNQSRIISIVLAGDKVLQCYLGLVEGLRRDLADGLTDDIVIARLLQRVNLDAPSILEPAQIFAAEKMHWRHVEHRNNRNAARMRLRRGTGQPSDSPFYGRLRASPKGALGAHPTVPPHEPHTLPDEPTEAEIAAADRLKAEAMASATAIPVLSPRAPHHDEET